MYLDGLGSRADALDPSCSFSGRRLIGQDDQSGRVGIMSKQMPTCQFMYGRQKA